MEHHPHLHPCPIDGCPNKIPQDRAFCRHHWDRVPTEMRSRLYGAFRRREHAKLYLDESTFVKRYTNWRSVYNELIMFLNNQQQESELSPQTYTT